MCVRMGRYIDALLNVLKQLPLFMFTGHSLPVRRLHKSRNGTAVPPRCMLRSCLRSNPHAASTRIDFLRTFAKNISQFLNIYTGEAHF